MVKWAILGLALLLALSGCKKDIQNEPAVKAGLLKYLAARTSLTEMEVKITSISFKNNQADATVHFQAKNDPNPGAGLEMKYLLEQKGSEWVVKSRLGGADHAASGGGMSNPHGGSMALPPGHPVIPASPSPAVPDSGASGKPGSPQ